MGAPATGLHTRSPGLALQLVFSEPLSQLWVRRNGGSWTRVPVRPHVAVANVSDGRHTLELRGVDAVGNAQDNVTVFTWRVDTGRLASALPSRGRLAPTWP